MYHLIQSFTLQVIRVLGTHNYNISDSTLKGAYKKIFPESSVINSVYYGGQSKRVHLYNCCLFRPKLFKIKVLHDAIEEDFCLNGSMKVVHKRLFTAKEGSSDYKKVKKRCSLKNL